MGADFTLGGICTCFSLRGSKASADENLDADQLNQEQPSEDDRGVLEADAPSLSPGAAGTGGMGRPMADLVVYDDSGFRGLEHIGGLSYNERISQLEDKLASLQRENNLLRVSLADQRAPFLSSASPSATLHSDLAFANASSDANSAFPSVSPRPWDAARPPWVSAFPHPHDHSCEDCHAPPPQTCCEGTHT